jgi:Fur family transcriptional regulator, ferric uptake regulator
MPQSVWESRVVDVLREAGLRSGTARRRVVALLARQDCALTALEIDRRLETVGRASVYRALEQLERLGLVQRVELAGGPAGYERLEPSGEHHHHLVCGRCGRVVPFADPDLERAIGSISSGADFDVSAHEVVLRGTCSPCGRRRRQKAASHRDA